MERVKIFYTTNDPIRIETDINTWLTQMGNGIEITRTMQSGSGSLDNNVTITIFYKNK